MANILLFRGSPRSNIDEVENENAKLPCDKLIIRYVGEFLAYKQARKFFLEHKEYTHLALATDDIIVKPDNIVQLYNDLEKEFNFAVISGMMNVDEIDFPNGNLNICYELALKDKKLRHYSWITPDRLPEKNIFPVKFAGFGLTCIRRDIVEMIPFATDSIFKGKGMQFGASLDFVFCWYCHEYGIPIYVDKRINMRHLRNQGKHRVGEKKPVVDFIPYSEQTTS